MSRLRALLGRAPTNGNGNAEKTPIDPWWDDHYDRAADQLLDFLREDGVELRGVRVADIGCGDGIIDLGVAHKSECAAFVGFDINPVDVGALAARAQSNGVPPPPASLSFVRCDETGLPAPDDDFDVVVSWSAFEHIADPDTVCAEVRRVLRPDGVLFVQLWPFFGSEHGSHLEEWWPEGWVQHRLDPDTIAREMRQRPGHDPAWVETKIRDYRELNRITLDRLWSALRNVGFRPCRVELLTHTVLLPPEVQDVPLSDLMIAGVLLTARPDNRRS